MAQLHTLVDTFSGTSLSASWTAFGNVSVNNQLTLTAIDVGNGGYVESVDEYSLVDSYASIKIIDPGVPIFNVFVSPLLLTSPFLDIYWQLESGFLKAYHNLNIVYSVYYSSAVSYVRITEYAGVVYWDTSSNGTTWTNRANAALGTLPDFKVVFQNEWQSPAFLTNTLTVDNFNSNSTTRFRTISGSLLYSGTVSRPEAERSRSISGAITFFGQVIATKQTVYTDTDRKTYLYKIYDESDSFIGLWNDVINEFRLPEELNTAGSTVTVELARNSDTRISTIDNLLDQTGANILDQDSLVISTVSQSPNQIGEGSNVDYNLRVDVYVFYGYTEAIQDQDGQDILDQTFEAITGSIGAPNGVRVYSGFISDISSRYGTTETTIVTLMTYGWDLDQYVVSSGSNTTVAFNSYDPSDIVREGLTAFATASSSAPGQAISYSSASVADTSTSVSYTFKVNTYLELLKKAVELAPSDWYFFLDQGTQLINFHSQSATPDHYFHLGKHIEDLDLRGNTENVVNDVYFVGGETAGVSLYERFTETPAAKTRRGLKRLTDSRVTLSATAELLSESDIERNNLILYRSSVTILDKKYDIESIRLGQMIGFRNFGNYIDDLQLQVVGRTYTPEAVELQLGTLLPKISKRVQDIRRNLEAQEVETVPTAPS